MSAVASSPSTPGRDSAVTSRSSSSVRLAMASGCRPRPGRRGPGGRRRRSSAGRRGRAGRAGAGWPAARRIRSGSVARISLRSAIEATKPSVVTASPRTVAVIAGSAVSKWTASVAAVRWDRPGEQGLDLLLGRHRGGALQPGGDDRAGGVGVLQHLLQRPAGQQAVAERAAEGVAGAEPVERRDRDRRGESTRSVRVLASTPVGPCLTMASSTPASSSASAARSGSVSPTATSHSSRLPTATVTCGSTLLHLLPGGGRRRPRTSGGSRGRAR